MIILLPSDDFDEGAGLGYACFRVEDARIACVIKIRRYTIIFRIS